MAATATVPYRVSWLIFLRPSSPSFWSRWKYGTTAPISWMMMEVEIYGMMPRPKIAALLNAPPAKMSYMPNSVFWLCLNNSESAAALIPGMGM